MLRRKLEPEPPTDKQLISAWRVLDGEGVGYISVGPFRAFLRMGMREGEGPRPTPRPAQVQASCGM